MTDPVFRRVLRRETHSPRTVAVIVAIALALIIGVYGGVEIVLSLLGRPPLLISPGAAVEWLVRLPDAEPAATVIASAVGCAVVGLVFVVLAVTPGRLARHRMDGGTRAVTVDNGVVAAALAQRVCDETGLAREDVIVGVGHRVADVTVHQRFYSAVEKGEVETAVTTELERFALIPAVRPRVRIVRPSESEAVA